MFRTFAEASKDPLGVVVYFLNQLLQAKAIALEVQKCTLSFEVLAQATEMFRSLPGFDGSPPPDRSANLLFVVMREILEAHIRYDYQNRDYKVAALLEHHRAYWDQFSPLAR